MSAFQAQVEKLPSRAAQHRKAPKTLRIRPERFADTWDMRPKDEIVVGLRVPSDDDEQSARNVASLMADRKVGLTGDAAISAYNDALIAAMVSRAICDPNDVLRAHPIFPLADSTIPLALSTPTLKWLFDELERLKIQQSPLFLEITDEETHELVDALCMDDPFVGVSEMTAAHARRYLKFALDLMNER